MRKKSLIAAICVVTLCAAQNLPAEQHYEFTGELERNPYIERANDVKDSSQISDIRKSILQDSSLSKDEKVNLIKKVGEIQIAKIEHEGNVELGWIYAEAALSAAIRAANLAFNKNPAAAGAIDSFAQDILEGKVRDTVVKGCETGDWSGLEKIAQSAGAGMIFGKLMSSDVIGKIPAVKNLNSKVSEGIGNFAQKTVYGEKLSQYAMMEANLYDDIYSTLKPKLGNVKAQMADIYKQIAKANTEAEKRVLNESLTALKEEASWLSNQISRKEAEIFASESLMVSLESSANTLKEATKNVVTELGKNINEVILNGKKSPDDQSVSDLFTKFCQSIDSAIINEMDKTTERVVTAQMKIAEVAFDVAESEYTRKMSEIATKYDSGNVVLTGTVEKNVYIDNSTGEIIQIDDGDVPANILNSTFADDPAEPKDAQTLANEAFDKEIDKIVKDIADGDQSLAQKIKDFVKDKIDEAIKKGEDWIENGGIRKTILEQVDKMLEGKVSSEDAQRIHNLVDTLCNVNKDGGESFCNTLGTDGKDLAVSLAVEALKKQLSDALPEDAADMVNAMLDVLKDKGTADDYKKAVLGQIQDLITKYVPYENTANTLNGIIQNIADGNAIDVMDSIKDVGKNLGVDLLKDTISKNLDPELANRINALLDGFAKDGIQGVTDEALSQIYGLIDKYAPGADSAQKLKDLIKGTLDGTITAPDFKNTATSIVMDGAKKLINDSNLPQDVKDLANTAIDGLADNGITGMTENVGDFIEDYVTDQLGEEAGDAVREIYDAVVTPGEDAWESVVKNAPTIGKAIGQKVLKWAEGKIAAQIDKLIAKYPALKSVLDRLGITGAGIVQGVKNVLSVLWNAPSLKDALKTLANMAVNFLKNIVGKLIDMALEYAFQWLASNLVPKVVDWATTTLQKWANSTDNPLLKKGLEWLSGQVGKCSKYASAKIKVSGVGDKVIKKLEKIIDGKKTDSKVHLETHD